MDNKIIGLENNYNETSILIKTAKNNVIKSINSQLVVLYWKIGEYVNNRILINDNAPLDEMTVGKLSEKLTIQYGRGFSRSNLLRMAQFVKKFENYEFVVTLSRQLLFTQFLGFR